MTDYFNYIYVISFIIQIELLFYYAKTNNIKIFFTQIFIAYFVLFLVFIDYIGKGN